MAEIDDNFVDTSKLNELLGSEVAGGLLLNEDIQSGNVLDFDGSGDSIDCGSDSSLAFSSNFSVGAWIKSSSSSNDEAIISKVNSSGTAGWNLNTTTFGGGRIRFWLNIGGTWYPADWASAGSVLTDDEWHFVVGTYDGETIRVYFDGELKASNTSPSGSVNESGTALKIGAERPTPQGFFNGKIANACAYSKTLSKKEIYDLYTIGVINESDLKGWWRLDEGTGTNAADSSGNGNDGTITGASWVEGSIYNTQSRTTSINLLEGI